MSIVEEDEGWNNRKDMRWGWRESAAVTTHGMGQMSDDKERAAETYLVGQVLIRAKMLNSRNLSDVKPTFVCVCDSRPYHTHFLCPCAIFRSGNHAELN